MTFVKTFKGYEDKTREFDQAVNAWVLKYGKTVEIVDIKLGLSHEPGARSGSGDLIGMVLYRAGAPVAE